MYPSKGTTLAKLGRFIIAVAERRKEEKPRQQTRLAVFIRFALDLAGFLWLTHAGFLVSSVVGSVVAGLSCFLLAMRISKAFVAVDNPQLT